MILLADHRGAGLERIRQVLEDAGRSTTLTHSLRETREALEGAAPALIVLDPLSEGGQVEVEQVELFCVETSGTSLLLVTDPTHLDAAVDASHRVEGAIWDLIHREAPIDEYLLRIDRLLHQVAYRDEVEELRYRASYDWTGLLRKEAFEERLEELTHQLAEPEVYRDPDLLRAVEADRQGVREQIQALYARWEQAAEEMAAADAA